MRVPDGASRSALVLLLSALCLGTGGPRSAESWAALMALPRGEPVEVRVDGPLVGAPSGFLRLQGRFVAASEDALRVTVDAPATQRIVQSEGGLALVELEGGTRLGPVALLSRENREVRIPRPGVVRVMARTGAHRGGRAAWIGAAVVFAGFSIADFLYDEHGLAMFTGLVAAPGGALIGYVWGRQIERRVTIYERDSELAVAPGARDTDGGVLEMAAWAVGKRLWLSERTR